jgi:hypothetical protein
MQKRELKFTCWHDTANGMMYQEFGTAGNSVLITVFFVDFPKIVCTVNGAIKLSSEDMSIENLTELQCTMQDLAEKMAELKIKELEENV